MTKAKPMITGFRIQKTRLRCKKPFRIATGVQDQCSALLVELQTKEGLTGYGEAVPLPYLTSETLEGAASALRDLLLPAVVGLQAWQIEEAHQRMNRVISQHPAARTAVDLAMHDLLGRQLGVPVFRILGGSGKPVETNYSIGLASPQEVATMARAIVEDGYSCIKLKVGDDSELDVERVRAVRAVIGPDVPLRIDANEGWNVSQAIRALNRMEPFHVQLCEQPVPRWDFKGMAHVRSRTSIPIAADESVRTPQDALRCIDVDAVDIVNLKLMKTGGLRPARDIVAVCRSGGVQMMVGGMVGESVLSVTAAATLASTFHFEYADLDADLLMKDQLQTSGGAALKDSFRHLPAGPGFGVEGLNPDFLVSI